MSRVIKKEDSSIDNVKRFFSTSLNSDVVSIEEAFKAWGRPDSDPEKNKAWLSNVLFHLKYHDLVTPVYSYTHGRKRIEKIQLTLKGKKALGRIGSATESESKERVEQNGEIKIEDILKALPKLRKENPDFNITLSVSPKEV